MKSKKDLVREAAEADLETFIRLVHPNRVLGNIHIEIICWWTRQKAGTHQLLLLPRDHQKSALVAYRVAWMITRNPAIRVLYISSTSNLAVKQLKFIKDILTSDIYRFYWPSMVNAEEAKREKWTETEISVDHPLRKAENVRDPTVFTAGLTTTITGMHSDIEVLDDVVVPENAYTAEGRGRVALQYSHLASIGGSEGVQWVVGTRYDPNDLYETLLTRMVEVYDENSNLIDYTLLFEVFGGDNEKKRQVEDRGDGTGQFLWPKQQRGDGRWFGFDANILAKKKGQYLDQVQFQAQYYNNPNDPAGNGISRELFQYYDPKHLNRVNGQWFFQGNRINVFAAIDFAYSLNKKADYTSIVIVGVDSYQNYYILDIDRFKTLDISEYYKHILTLFTKWNFRKLRAEVTGGQKAIVQDLKQNYIARYGLGLSVEEYAPTRNEGTKEERIYATLQPRYANQQMWHYQAGNCQLLEEELIHSRPQHDDIKDALASCVSSCIAPSYRRMGTPVKQDTMVYNQRFGGIL